LASPLPLFPALPRELEVDVFEGPFQPTHLLVVLALAVMVFEPKKLPELGRGLGDGIRGFKNALREKGSSTPIENKKTADG
jgi:sec-independent protein translocase protein TatA